MTDFTVLYIEDNDANRLVIQRIVENWSFNLLQAKSAEEGLELARQRRPNLILMDIGLPGIDGLEATRLLKQDPNLKNIPVIAITGATSIDPQEYLDAGCVDCILKPITISKVLTAIRQHWVYS